MTGIATHTMSPKMSSGTTVCSNSTSLGSRFFASSVIE